MGTDAHEPSQGQEHTVEGGVILRFPGDWVGPLEELVPFGPSARKESPSQPAASEQPDFWGESSSALQGVLEEPASAPTSARASGPLRGRHRRTVAVSVLIAAATLTAGIVLATRSPGPAPVRGMTFAIASIPPLAPPVPVTSHTRAAVQRTKSVVSKRAHRTTSTARPSGANASSAATDGSSGGSTTPQQQTQSSYHPAPASASSSSQSGGAFTLGGP